MVRESRDIIYTDTGTKGRYLERQTVAVHSKPSYPPDTDHKGGVGTRVARKETGDRRGRGREGKGPCGGTCRGGKEVCRRESLCLWQAGQRMRESASVEERTLGLEEEHSQ